MKERRRIFLILLDVLLFICVPMSVVFLMTLAAVITEGREIHQDRVLFFAGVVLSTILLKITKHKLKRYNQPRL